MPGVVIAFGALVTAIPYLFVQQRPERAARAHDPADGNPRDHALSMGSVSGALRCELERE
jgi:hypothetical protein